MTGQCSGELVRAGQTGGGANVSFPQIDGQLSGTSTDGSGSQAAFAPSWNGVPQYPLVDLFDTRGLMVCRLSSLRSVQISSVVLGIGLDGHCPPGSDHQPSRKRSPICASWWALSTLSGHSLCLKPDSRVSQ